MLSTEELVKAAQAGESSAFEELVRRYERAAIITAFSVLGDFHSAQDAAQEAFIIAYQRLGRLHGAASFGPWLLKITRRRSLRLKCSPKTEPINPDSVLFVEAPDSDWMEPYKEVVQQLTRLPEQERIVAILRHMDGRSIKEIADATGRPVGTITKQLSRAIQRLRNWFVEVQS